MGRMRQMVETSTTGIDGSGKTTACVKASQKLAQNNCVVMDSSRPVLEFRGDRQVEHFKRLIFLVDAMRVFADASNSRKVAFVSNLAVVLLQTRLLESLALRRIQPDVTMVSRDYIVDPVVYSTFYSKKLAGGDAEKRMRQVQLLTGSQHKDIIFWLTLDPEEAMRRIGLRETNHLLPPSNRHKYMHENTEALRGLQEQYRATFEIVQKVSPGTEIYELRSDRLAADEVADKMTTLIRSRLEHRVFQNLKAG